MSFRRLLDILLGVLFGLFIGVMLFSVRQKQVAFSNGFLTARMPLRLAAHANSHPIVQQDADGWYWAEPRGNGPYCFSCHKGRWTQASGLTATPMRMEFVTDQQEFLPEKPNSRP